MLEYRVVRGYLRKQSEEVQLRDQPVSEPEYALAIENACCILTVSRRVYWCIRFHYYCRFFWDRAEFSSRVILNFLSTILYIKKLNLICL